MLYSLYTHCTLLTIFQGFVKVGEGEGREGGGRLRHKNTLKRRRLSITTNQPTNFTPNTVAWSRNETIYIDKLKHKCIHKKTKKKVLSAYSQSAVRGKGKWVNVFVCLPSPKRCLEEPRNQGKKTLDRTVGFQSRVNAQLVFQNKILILSHRPLTITRWLNDN